MPHPFVEDRISDEYLSVNCCGCQHHYGYDRGSTRPNGRRDFHILYITEGVCFLRKEEHGEEIEVPAGSVILYFPGEPQFYRFRAEIPSTSYYIHFSGTGCTDLLSRAGLSQSGIIEIGDSNTLKALLGKLIDDFNLSAPMYEELCAGYLLELLSLIGRKLQYKSMGISTQQNTRIEGICRQMHRDYRSERTISDYAAECRLSESRFSHLFKERTGVSPHRYLLEIRIGYACELLMGTDLSIAQICTEIGIADQNYFSRVFKKIQHCSPSEYRKRI